MGKVRYCRFRFSPSNLMKVFLHSLIMKNHIFGHVSNTLVIFDIGILFLYVQSVTEQWSEGIRDQIPDQAC